MAIEMSLQAEIRDAAGKGPARRLRRTGKVPGVLYGARKEALPVAVDPKQLAAILRSDSGQNTIFELRMDGEKTAAMIVDWQREPVRGALIHVDLKRIAMDQRLRVRVPVQSQGEPTGVKLQGGILELVTREIELECLPGDIPEHITVDVSELSMGQNLRVGDLQLAPGLKVLTESDRVVAHIVAVKEEEVAPAAAAVEGAEAAPAEPEIIKKGKAEGKEGEEAAAPAEEGGKKKSSQ